MKLTVVGCGDAFGSGGRLQTSFHVTRANGGHVLIDCGATSLIGMHKLGLDPDAVSHIFITHLHGDHFSGLVWWLMHAEFVSKRKAPLTIVGPPGLEGRLRVTSEALFPSALPRVPTYALKFEVHHEGSTQQYDGIDVSVCEVRHPSGAPSYAIRLSFDGKTIAFSGDSAWVEGLIDISRDADLFICECFSHELKVSSHMSWREIEARLPDITAKIVMLTHMNSRMLEASRDISHPRVVFSEDGLVREI